MDNSAPDIRISDHVFPAILIAGPPNCGKSVLSYLLTENLRRLKIAHYLLRTAPDGEGDWFYRGQLDSVRTIRLGHKGSYSTNLVRHMQKVISTRSVPLLVDIGGKPSGDQFEILKACTHAILLYKETKDLEKWISIIDNLHIKLVAILQSSLSENESIGTTAPYLEAIIKGLDRDQNKRACGIVFSALLDRVVDIVSGDESQLAEIHRISAPLPWLSESELAFRLDIPMREGKFVWYPEDLMRISNILPHKKSYALYGRGPVWLAAMIGILALPRKLSIFDIRYGWKIVPWVYMRDRINVNVRVIPQDYLNAEWLEVTIPSAYAEPGRIYMPPQKGTRGVIISGRLPRWMFTALARKYAVLREWVGIDDPGFDRIIVIYSKTPAVKTGCSIPRNVFVK